MPTLFYRLVFDPAFRKRRYASAWLVFAAILIMGSVPGARAEIGVYAPGVVLHSLAYAVITFLLYSGSTGTRRQRAVRAILTVATMGAIDELLQSTLPYRSGDPRDWAVDCTAALVTASLLAAFLPEPEHPRNNAGN